jgi:hypothetical protein
MYWNFVAIDGVIKNQLTFVWLRLYIYIYTAAQRAEMAEDFAIHRRYQTPLKYTTGPTVTAAWLEREQNVSSLYRQMFRCLKCAPGCETCHNNAPCLAVYNWPFRWARTTANEWIIIVIQSILPLNRFTLLYVILYTEQCPPLETVQSFKKPHNYIQTWSAWIQSTLLHLILFNILILSSFCPTPKLPSDFFHYDDLNEIAYALITTAMEATCPSDLVLFGLTILTISVADYTLLFLTIYVYI